MNNIIEFRKIYLTIVTLNLCSICNQALEFTQFKPNRSQTGLVLNHTPTFRHRNELALGSVQSDQSTLLDMPHPLLSDPLFDSSILTDDAGRVIQSTECTPQERKNRIQCFDKLPDEKYAVSLGNTVNMQCVVLNQHGKVQWRAKKILLGYDRSIPGYQRYRIIGDVGRGEHTLQIMDVQLEDAGEYECQVTPVPANNHPLLRRKTELIVLIKPSIPSILYPDVPPPDKQLIISKPDPILRITVLCVAVGGSPPPHFTWRLNNKEIPQFKPTPSLRRSSHVKNPWSKLDPLIETQTESGQSRLTLLKSGLQDGDQLMCSVTNAATQLHHDPNQRNLTTHVTIRIHTPPGPPRIISPETDHVYLEGEELKAICVASPPGNPLGGLFWRWLLHPAQFDELSSGPVSGLGGRGGARLSDYNSVEAYMKTLETSRSSTGTMVTDEYSSTAGTFRTLTPISEDVQPLHYTLNKDKDQLVNTLVIPRIHRRYHAAKLVCETGHPVGSAHQTSISIYVKHPPENVTISIEGGVVREEISAGRREFVVYGLAGEVKTIICRTGPYYRDAQIKWVAQGPDPGLLKAPRELFGHTRTIQTPDGFSRIQESRVNVTITEADDRGYIDCRVWGEGDSRVDARVRLDIIYAPGVPVISGYKSLEPIKMAHSLEMMCTTSGGNPPPELAWFKDNQQIVPTGEVTVVGRQSSLKLKIIPQKEDNGAHYHCSARNAATGLDGIQSEPIILNVLFPPERIVISFHSPPVVSSGHQLVINCQSDTSNPVATISWWHFRCGPAHAFTQTGLKPTDAASIENTKCKSVAMQGTNEKPTPGAFGGLQAHSRLWLRPTWHYHLDYIECRTENPDYGPPVWHDRLQLNITFAPQFLGLQAGTEKVIREGQTMKMDLGPYANPPISTVRWFVNGVPVPNEPSDTQDLKGVYTSGRNGELLALYDITRSHMANYTVMATNREAESRAVFFLNVTYPAELIGPAEENVTETTNGIAQFDCVANANPAVAIRSFTWYRYVPPKGWPEDSHEAVLQLSAPIPCNESTTSPSHTDRLFVYCQQENQFRMTSRLSLYHLTEDDVGSYLCEVNNGLGEPVQKRVNFLYPFPPTMIRLPRYTKAAGEQGTQVTLVCFIRTEPEPRVGWLKDGQLIRTDAQHQSKYQFSLNHIRPGLYKAALVLNNLQKTDFGTYQCQAVNVQGEAMLAIQMSGTSIPDVPLNVRLLNATRNTLRVAWTQGFDGGISQTFQVRWRQAEMGSMYRYADVAANDNQNAAEYLITGLEPGTEYLVSVNSMNAKHGASEFTDPIHVRTEYHDGSSGKALLPPLSSSGHSDDNALLIIVAACVFGFVVFVINLIVITFLLKRRRQRRHLARQRKLRTDEVSTLTMTNGFAMARPDQSYEQSGLVDPKTMFKSSEDPITSSFMSDSAGGCMCCAENRHKHTNSSYVKADSFETFARPNGHPGHVYGHDTIVPDSGSQLLTQQGSQQPQHPGPHAKFYPQSSISCSPDPIRMTMMPDFGHTTNNHYTPGFNVSHSYHSSNTLNRGAFALANSVDMSSSRQINASEMNGTSVGLLYGGQSNSAAKEPLLASHQPRITGQTIYNQYTPRQSSSQTKYAGTLRSPSSLAKIKPSALATLTGGGTLPRNSGCVTITNPALFYNNHESSSTLCPPSNGSLQPNVIQSDTPKQAARSSQILSTGLAAFSTHRPHMQNEQSDQFEDVITSHAEASNQSTSGQQLVSIKLADSMVEPNVALPTSPLPSSFYNDASLEYALSSSCTPLLLSLDTATQLQFASPNSILMTTDPGTAPATAYPTGYYDFDGTLTTAPILVQTQNPLAYTQLPTIGNPANTKTVES